MKQSWGILGVPSELGANRRGTANSPNVILKEVFPRLKHATWLGMVPVPEKKKKVNLHAKHLKEIGALCNAVHLPTDLFPVVIGGDHSVTYCVVKEMICHSRCGLVYCDAHGDYNTPKTTPSGNVHGMVISEIVGKANHKELGLKSALVPEKNIVLIGVRELDPQEKVMLGQSDITIFPPAKVREIGPRAVMKKAVRIATAKRKGFHLSIDIDVVDKEWVKATSTPSSGGISPRELLGLVTEAFNHNIVSMDIMEYNPVYDQDRKTLEVISQVLHLVDSRF